MKNDFIIKNSLSEVVLKSIFGKKSALVLAVLFSESKKDGFSLREVQRQSGVSVGLVQKVFTYLLNKGYLKAEGVRTAKSYKLIDPEKLLNEWFINYNIQTKCKMYNYKSTGYNEKEIIKIIESDKYLKKNITSATYCV